MTLKKTPNNTSRGHFGYFRDLIAAFKNGDKYVRLSSVAMGTGYIARKQVIKGILVFLVQILFILSMIFF